MQTISYTKLRNSLASSLDEVCQDHHPLLITRQSGKNAVLISLDDFNSYEETAYLLRSPRNAARLVKAMDDLKHKKNILKNKKLIEE